MSQSKRTLCNAHDEEKACFVSKRKRSSDDEDGERLVLVPHRNGQRLFLKIRQSSNGGDNAMSKREKPSRAATKGLVGCIALSPPENDKGGTDDTSSSSDSIVLGRHEILPCMYQACGCNEDVTSSQNKCVECQKVNAWALHAISRKLIRITSRRADNHSEPRDIKTRRHRLFLQVRGKHARVWLNSKQLTTTTTTTTTTSKGDGRENKDDNNNDLTASCWDHQEYNELLAGSKLRIQPQKGQGALELEVMPQNEFLSLQTTNMAASTTAQGTTTTTTNISNTAPTKPPSMASSARTIADDNDMSRVAATTANVPTNKPPHITKHSRTITNAQDERGDEDNDDVSVSPHENHQESADPNLLTQPFLTQPFLTQPNHPIAAVPKTTSSAASNFRAVARVSLNHHSEQDDNDGNSTEAVSVSLLDGTSPMDHHYDENTQPEPLANHNNNRNDAQKPKKSANHDNTNTAVIVPKLPAHPNSSTKLVPPTGTAGTSSRPTNNEEATPQLAGLKGNDDGSKDRRTETSTDKAITARNTPNLEKKKMRNPHPDKAVPCLKERAAPNGIETIVDKRDNAHNKENPPAATDNANTRKTSNPNETIKNQNHPAVHGKEMTAQPKQSQISTSKQGNSSVSLSKYLPPTICLYICPLGQDLPMFRRRSLTQKALQMGAVIVTAPRDYKQATHFVVSDLVASLAAVAETLHISEETLKEHLDANSVQCVLPTWIASAIGARLEQPAPRQRWHGYTPNKKKSNKRESSQESETSQQKRQRCISAIVHKTDTTTTNIARKSSSSSSSSPFPKNLELAQVFKELAILHQTCPLLPVDSWKAYMFRVVAGRIQNLEFEISHETLPRLKHIKGIGSSSFEKIGEYLQTGSMARIKEFQTDPRRIAMKHMMDIWGVGRVKASELVMRGFKSIQDILHGIATKKLFLDRNQLVGADCYEDLLEEMSRTEVEEIGRIITQHVVKLYPGAEATVMGSYRRGKPTCGDVDVHIVHKSYSRKIPADALGKIVDALWKSGHIAFHLTFLKGMQTGSTLEDFQNSARHIPGDAWEFSNQGVPSTRNKETGASYMGVFNSPHVSMRRRRVDIKFYPYRERVFASLYFTGNGFFNRSMRLWASRKFGYSLNDHGLFRAGTTDRVMKGEVSEEKEVFDKLGLVYKKPTERDCFDACVPLDLDGTNNPQGGMMDSVEMTEREFYKDSAHVWVK